MNNLKSTLGLLAIAVTLSFFLLSRATAGEYVLIVNTSNNYSATEQEMKNVVKQLFLKNTTDWPGGKTQAQAYAQADDSDAQKAFNNTILGMSEIQLAEHWIKVKQTKGATSNRKIPNAAMILKFVEKNEGGFGFIKKSEATSAVKVLFEF